MVGELPDFDLSLMEGRPFAGEQDPRFANLVGSTMGLGQVPRRYVSGWARLLDLAASVAFQDLEKYMTVSQW